MFAYFESKRLVTNLGKMTRNSGSSYKLSLVERKAKSNSLWANHFKACSLFLKKKKKKFENAVMSFNSTVKSGSQLCIVNSFVFFCNSDHYG